MKRWTLLAFSISTMALPAWAVTVPGTSDPWLAGMPDGSTASSGDVAPAQSPVLFSGTIAAGDILLFSVSGSVNFVPSPSGDPPDGNSSFIPHSDGAQNGIANVIAPVNSLIGLFLGGSQPDSTAAPNGLDFSAIGTDFLTLSPGLKQPFFIGDGLASGGAPQQFTAPAGATRLFLGTMDGFGWFNNFGDFQVNARVRDGITVPDGGATVLLLGLALSSIAGLHRRLSR